MELKNTYGDFTLEGVDMDWDFPVYTVRFLNRPLVEMIDTIFEDHQVMYQHSTRRNPYMCTMLCGGHICLEFKLVHLDHLSSEPHPAEHQSLQDFYRTFWEQDRPVLKRSSF